MAKNNIGKSNTSKYWATIIYDDCDISFIDRSLKSLHVPCALSPIHNLDFYDGVEDITYYEDDVDMKSIYKVPHYHLLCAFPNSIGEKSFRYMLEHKLPSFVHWRGCELINNEKGYGRYLCHLDDLDKAQYDTDEILYYCGYNDSILESPKKNEREKYEDIEYFVSLILSNGIEDMMSLYQYVAVINPSKLSLVMRYSSTLEKFTRGMYQQSLRKERAKGGRGFTATKNSPFD